MINENSTIFVERFHETATDISHFKEPYYEKSTVFPFIIVVCLFLYFWLKAN